ncbi:MAG: biotin--[acetyl-CoA-carboxylase] ligase [Candidatus Dormibacteraeota bacterium]|nr:biotin--[acetyl-CoA-carboxylase] ligase [Candidatus Dormibacteraeota bacterium]
MRLIRLASTPSTQDAARGLPLGSVVVADQQTAGRGRLGRRWDAPPGSALLASFVLPSRPLASLAAGVAAAVACGESVRLKWPNDLLIDGRKLAGILVEQRGGRCVVGIGVNLTWAPPGAGRLEADRDRLLERLKAELERWFAADDFEVLAAWRARSDTLGRRVRVELPGETFEGWAEDVAEDGSLLVDGRAVTAGDVIHLRAAGSPEGSLPRGL